MKKIISILLVAVMLVGFVPMTAKAETECVHDYTSSSTFLKSLEYVTKDNKNGFVCVVDEDGDDCHYSYCTNCNQWVMVRCSNPANDMFKLGCDLVEDLNTCSYCGNKYTYHTDIEWKTQSTEGNCYWYCSCGAEGTPHDHYYGEKIEVGGTSYGVNCGTTCLKCGYIRSDAPHEWEYASNSTQHWQVCTECGVSSDRQDHSGGTATCSAYAQCEVCGAEYGKKAAHESNGKYQYDNDNHWLVCKNCSTVYDANAHTFGDWYKYSLSKQRRDCITEGCDFYEEEVYRDYTVTFDTSISGTEEKGTEVDSQTVIWGNCVKKPDNPTATGYKFVGWYKDKALKYEYDFSNPVKEIIEDGTHGDITIYSKWEEVSYSISYCEKDGTGFKGTHDDGYPTSYKYGTVVKLKSAKESGYEFKGWSLTPSCKETIDELNSETLAGYDFKDGIKLYAKLQGHTYTINYNCEAAHKGEMPYDNTEVYTYGVGKQLRKNMFTREGYAFVGWTKNKSGTGTVYQDMAEVTNLTTKNDAVVQLYAKWEARVYQIEYYDQGGAEFTGDTETWPIPTTHTYGDKTILEDPYRAGYNFVGWFKDKDCTQEISELGAYDYTDTIVLYAKWEARKNYISYSANGTDVSGYMANQTFTSGDEVTLSENQYKRTSYSFLGWSEDSGEENTVKYTDKQSGLEFYSDNPIDLYAVWGKNYNVTLVTNGGTIADGKNVTGYSHKVATTLPTASDITKSGYTFSGWYESADFSGDAVTVIPATATGDKTYYAKWVEATYYVTFTLASSTTTGGTATVAVDGGTATTVTTSGLIWKDLKGGEEIVVTAKPNSSYYAKIYTDSKTLATSSKGTAVTYQLTADDIKANSVIKIAFSTNPYTADEFDPMLWVIVLAAASAGAAITIAVKKRVHG